MKVAKQWSAEHDHELWRVVSDERADVLSKMCITTRTPEEFVEHLIGKGAFIIQPILGSKVGE
jgi:hypothetical protein